jgi:6-phosphofructokinase 1
MRDRGKKSSIIVVAEGAARGHDVEKYIDAQAGFEARCVVLGHMQRGGSPSAFDRVLALRMGSMAANRLISGYSGEMIGMDRNRLISHPLNYVLGTKKMIDPEKLLLVDVMAR